MSKYKPWSKRGMIEALEASPCGESADITVWTNCKCGLAEHFVYGIEDNFVASRDRGTPDLSRRAEEGWGDIVDLGISDGEGDPLRTLKELRGDDVALTLALILSAAETSYNDGEDYNSVTKASEWMQANGIKLVKERNS